MNNDNCRKYTQGLVSVIIPTYKRADKLLRAINSVCNQTYENMEILVVNDNENDDQYTKEIASYASSASKIGLMYASDWGYAIEGFTEVLGSSGRPQSYMNKNWLFSNGHEWTISAYNSSYPLDVSNSGYLNVLSVSDGFAARPVLYLKSSVYVVSGTGTKVDPYRIGM